MASASGIKAGSAYVEATLNDAKLQRGLKRAQRRVQRFGATVAGMGRNIAIVGGGIVAFGALTARSFMKSGDAIDKAARRAAISAEDYQKLRLAAEEAGASGEDIVKGVQTSSRAIYEAGRGTSTYVDALGKLGLSYADLENLDPADQFRTIVDELSNVDDKTTRAAVAQQLLGRAGKTLMPMLEGGAKGLAEVAKRAEEAGIIIDNDTVAAAAELTDQFGLLKSQAKSLAVGIGSALAGPMGSTFEWLQKILKASIDYAKANPGVVQSVMKIGLALTGVGVLLSAVGIGIVLLGTVIGSLGTILSAVGAAFGMAGTAAATFWALATGPAGLAIATFVGVFAAVTALTGGFDQVKAGAADAFAAVKDDALVAADGIKAAFMAGDIAGVFKILWALIKLEWTRGVEAIKAGASGLWIDVQTAWEIGVDGIIRIFTAAIDKIKSAWIDVKSFITAGIGAISGDMEIVQGAEITQRQEKAALANKSGQRDAARTEDVEKRLTELSQARQAVTDAAADRVAEARKELEKQVAAVKAAAAEEDKRRQAKQDEAADNAAGGLATPAAKALTGGFSAQIINRNLGRMDPERKKQDEIAANTKKTALNLEKVVKQMKANFYKGGTGPVFA